MLLNILELWNMTRLRFALLRYIILFYTWWKLEMPTQCRTYEKMVRGALGSLESGVYPDVIPEARFCGKGTLPLLLKGSW